MFDYEYCNEDEIRAMEEDEYRKKGYYIHAICVGDQIIHMHTHGLLASRGHKELEIQFPLDTDIMHGIISKVVNIIDSGRILVDGEKLPGILKSHLVKVVDVGEGSFHDSSDYYQAMRIIFPDDKGRFPGEEGCTSELILSQLNKY